MFNKRLIVSTGLAGILALGVCGCSFSSSSKTEVSTSSTDEGGTTTTTTTTTETSTEDGTSTTTETTTTSDSDRMDMSEWTNYWMGTSTAGYDVYYSESPSGEEAFLVLRNAEKNDLLSYIGSVESPEENVYTIKGAEHMFTFVVEDVDKNADNLTFNLGDDCGTVEVKRCTVDEFVDAIHEFDTNGDLIQ